MMDDKEKVKQIEEEIEIAMNKLEKLQQEHIHLTGQRHRMPIYLSTPLWAKGRGK